MTLVCSIANTGHGKARRSDRTTIGSASLLTLNLGLRYERLGQFADMLGRNSTFDITKADPNPPPEGTVAGYVVASNFQGTIPPGVTRAGNPFATNAAGQNSLAPRVGFSWRIFPRLSSFLVERRLWSLFFAPNRTVLLCYCFGPTIFCCTAGDRSC